MVVAILALLLSGLGLKELGFNDGSESIYASDNVHYRNFQAFAEEFSATGNGLAVLVTSADSLTVADIDVLRDFVLDALLAEGVEAVFSLFSLQRLDPETGLLEPVLIDLEQEGFDGNVARVLQAARGLSFAGFSVIDDTLSETVVILSLDPSRQSLDAVAPVRKELSALMRQRFDGTHLTAKMTGQVPIRDFVVNQVRRDQPIINLLGAVFGFCVSWFIFRSPWIALFNGIAPVFALVLSLGLMGLLGFEINVINTALPVLVMVLASSDCTHITYEIRNRCHRGDDVLKAIERAMTELISPCVLTSLTTILAFASLSFATSPIIRELSLSGGLSVASALVAVLIIHPLAFSFATRFSPLRTALLQPLRADRRMDRRRALFDGILGSRKIVVVASLGLFAGMLIAVLPPETSYRPNENIRNDHPLIRTLDRVEAFSGPTSAIALPLRLNSEGALLTPETLSEIEQLHKAALSAAPGASVVSLHTIAEFLRSNGGKDTVEAVREVLDILPEHYLHRIVSRSGDALLLSVFVTDLRSSELRILSDTILTELNNVQTETLTIGTPTDALALSAFGSHEMILQLVISFAIVVILCPLLIGLWFGRMDFVVLAFLPNVLPILVIGAALMISDVHIQFSSALALTIAFGIAVDDTVHVFNRLNLNLNATGGRLTIQAIAEAMTRTAPALLTTTCILSAGLISVLWSVMPMIEYFGLLCIATFVLALLADLIILPATAALLSKDAK